MPAVYMPPRCHPEKGCFTCPYPDCKCMAMPTVEESELKAAGNQIPYKRLENGKEVTGWLNHSLAGWLNYSLAELLDYSPAKL